MINSTLYFEFISVIFYLFILCKINFIYIYSNINNVKFLIKKNHISAVLRKGMRVIIHTCYVRDKLRYYLNLIVTYITHIIYHISNILTTCTQLTFHIFYLKKAFYISVCTFSFTKSRYLSNHSYLLFTLGSEDLSSFSIKTSTFFIKTR